MKKQAYTLTTILSLLSFSAFGADHSITNTTSKQIRIEGFNTDNPTDLYFSELIEPGETRSYVSGTHYPNFAIRLMHQAHESLQINPNAKISVKTPELPYQGSTVTVKQRGDTHTITVQGH